MKGTWTCDVVSPFDQDPIKKDMFYEWCMTNCVNARPHERDCPETHCNCYPTDKSLSQAEIRQALAKTDAPTKQQPTAVTTSAPVDPNDHSWKSQATIAINPVSS